MPDRIQKQNSNDMALLERLADNITRISHAIEAMRSGVEPRQACRTYQVTEDILKQLLDTGWFLENHEQVIQPSNNLRLAADIFETPIEHVPVHPGRLAFTLEKAINSLPDQQACAIWQYYYAKTDAPPATVRKAIQNLRHPDRKAFIMTGKGISQRYPMPSHLAHALEHANIYILNDLASLTTKEAMQVRGIGHKSMEHLRKILKGNHMHFKDENPEETYDKT